MPDFMNVVNAGLVGVLGLLVWKLPEIVRIIFDYLGRRQEARDKEVEKLLDAFRVELRYEREQSAAQFEKLLAAIEARACGFLEQHRPHVVAGTVPATTP